MGVWLEAKTRAACEDLLCITKTAIEIALKKIGVALDQNEVDEHARKLAELIEEEFFEYPYKFTVPGLEVTIYDVDYDVDECTYGCEGDLEVRFEVDGNIKPVVEKLLKDMGVDNVKICE
jgi:hypothetical protein